MGTYWVEKNVLKASPLRKSLAERRPATGRSWNPVRLLRKSEMTGTWKERRGEEKVERGERGERGERRGEVERVERGERGERRLG
jgi:hypothetical protein